MSPAILTFFVLAGLAVLGALSLVLQKHPIHSALSLIVVMVSLAGLYLLMGAEFVAMVQIIVYGGAIMVLFIFVIMLLNAGEEEHTDFSQLAKFAGLPLALALTASLAALVFKPDAESHRTNLHDALQGIRLPVRIDLVPHPRRHHGRARPRPAGEEIAWSRPTTT